MFRETTSLIGEEKDGVPKSHKLVVILVFLACLFCSIAFSITMNEPWFAVPIVLGTIGVVCSVIVFLKERKGYAELCLCILGLVMIITSIALSNRILNGVEETIMLNDMYNPVTSKPVTSKPVTSKPVTSNPGLAEIEGLLRKQINREKQLGVLEILTGMGNVVYGMSMMSKALLTMCNQTRNITEIQMALSQIGDINMDQAFTDTRKCVPYPAFSLDTCLLKVRPELKKIVAKNKVKALATNMIDDMAKEKNYDTCLGAWLKSLRDLSTYVDVTMANTISRLDILSKKVQD